MKARHIVVITCLLLGVAPLRAESLQQNYLGVYLEINSAWQQEKAQDYMGALVHYQVAESFLAKMQKNYPDWETALVTHRLMDCQSKITSLAPLAAKQLAGMKNEWSLGAASLESQDAWSALDRAQAKVTYAQVMRTCHPELAKAGFADQIREEQKVVDDLETTELSHSAPANKSQVVQ